MLFKSLYGIGDHFEDKVRARLSHTPLIYAALGGAGIVLFWRGIWHTVDYLTARFFGDLPWWDGPLSIGLGTILLLSIGLFVASFIGDAIILSGLKSEKKLTEKTEEEILAELDETDQIRTEVHLIEKRMRHIEKLMAASQKRVKRTTEFRTKRAASPENLKK